jgi:predicted DNA-binding transcriptional regulator YafY
MTARQLAEELEVSVRTVYRDVESLSAAGVPVYADRGPAGGYRLVEGYRTRLTGLTGDEADSLFLTGLPGPARELGLGAELAAAELKLMAALPAALRDRAARVRERFHLDAPGWFHDGTPTPHLAEVADAVWRQRVIKVVYRRWGPEEVRRTLEPLGLVLKAGSWYLVARSAGDLRTYRITRIVELEITDETFQRPDGFDLVGFWAAYQQTFRERMHAEKARIRISEYGRRLLPYGMDAYAARVAMDGAGPPDEDGWTEIVLPIASVAEAHGELLRLGVEVEVLDPPELRARLARTARVLAERYT